VAVLLGLPAHRREDFCRIWEVQALLLLPDYQRPFPGVLKMLDALSSCARLCIASNGKPEYLQASLELMGIKKYFHEVKGGAPGRTKGQSVKELLSDSFSRRVMMAGDRMADIQAGRDNGLYTVAACYGYGSPEEWADADWKAQTVEELTDICLAFCQR
jgi:phosphoglycolate phosphatase